MKSKINIPLENIYLTAVMCIYIKLMNDLAWKKFNIFVNFWRFAKDEGFYTDPINLTPCTKYLPCCNQSHWHPKFQSCVY